MRIDRLELIRYGKFTDQAIELPRAEHDFHFIVGPNEAGKSTVRSALLDLLYGFPKSSPYAFMHPMPDLRLGALLTHDGQQVLEFHRTKGYKTTLRTPSDTPLPDDALVSLLGVTDQKFFEQMFSLDHERLLKGGASILSASDDAGQLLFESAAGIASFGDIRNALETEADSLWAKRKSGARAYYQAEQVYEQARQAIKAATLRVKDWEAAHDKVEELTGQLNAAREELAKLKTRRDLLQRVWRVGPLLAALDSHSVELAKYAGVPELPESAAATLDEAERGLAIAQVERTRHLEAKVAAEAALAGLKVDQRLLDQERDIVDLDGYRLQYRAYPNDIEHRQSEIRDEWKQAKRLAEELGWDVSSEEELAERMPPSRTHMALVGLVRKHSGLRQRKESAKQALRAKTNELEQAKLEREKLGQGQTPPTLHAAIAQARRLGDVAAALRVFRQEERDREQDLRNAMQALIGGEMGPEHLRAMLVPSREAIQGLVDAERNDAFEARSLSRRLRELTGQIADQEAKIQRIRNSRHPVLHDDVLLSRQARDEVWEDIKQKPSTLAERANRYEQLVAAADSLADQRHDKAKDAAELQAAQDRLGELGRERDDRQEQLDALQDQMHQREQQWIASRTECSLPALSFQTAAEWLSARERALAALDAHARAQSKLHEFGDAVSEARADLATELTAAGVPPADGGLEVMLAQADDWAQAADQAHGQRKTLQRQIDSAEMDLKALRQDVEEAHTRYERWVCDWSAALAEAGFQPEDNPDTVEAALNIVQRIDAALSAIQSIRTQRIGAMQADLRSFEFMAQEVTRQVALDLAGRSAADVALELKRRLEAAHAIQSEAKRQSASVDNANKAIENAGAEIQRIQATIAPLMQRSGAATREELREAIQKSDERSRWQAKVDEAKALLLEQGDRLPIDRLREEVTSAEPASAPTELNRLGSREDELVNLVATLSAQQEAARTAFLAMTGAADAAKAEADRQEALSQIAAAVERYIKVHTAARLLSWSIEQYRETKQGPMLAAASRIFAYLTLGSFERLTVDFERNPPTLQGRRPNGTAVGVEGMSDGTRDQLYLALRLAALDMHLAQAHVLPFIADDLFINFDARRAKAGLEALADLSRRTQVLFLTHHDHLLPLVREVYGTGVNVVQLR